MNKFITTARVTSVTFVALMILAVPFAPAQAADAASGYSYSYSYSNASSNPGSSYSYSYPSSGYSYSYSYPSTNSGYSYSYSYPSTDSGYSYSYSYPTYTPAYTPPTTGCTYNCGGGCSYNCNPPKEKPAPTCDLSINPSRVDYGEDATLSWSSTNASSVSLSGFGSVSKSGSRTVYDITDNETFVLTVKGNGKTVTCDATIKVEEEEQDDLECKLKASDSHIERGDSVKITWSSDGAEYGKISPSIGEVDEDGSETVRPREDTTYKGTFYNDDGDKVTCSVKVKVDEDYVYIPETPYITLSAVPYTGFELGPVGTAIYWSLLVLWCLIAAYLIAVKKAHVAIARRLNSFLFGTREQAVPTAPRATVVHNTATTHSAHAVHSDATDEFVLSQLARGRHAH